jgi:mevalonate kinase
LWYSIYFDMPAFTSSAPGKVILFGEHAVVYGKPAIAVPVEQLKARAVVEADPRSPAGSVRLWAPDIGLDSMLNQLDENHPLVATVMQVQAACGFHRLPACKIKLTSTIPVASGLGSGAAISVAMIRALSAFLGCTFTQEQVCAMAYEVEKIHHGTPSGLDNTVITYDQPIFFVRGKSIQFLVPAQSFTVVIGDTGISSPTLDAVREVRQAWEEDRTLYDGYFESLGNFALSARKMIEAGEVESLGSLMQASQEILRKMRVSSPALDSLVSTALEAGAWGAKLSGGGRGGNMIALTSPQRAERVAQALKQADRG